MNLKRLICGLSALIMLFATGCFTTPEVAPTISIDPLETVESSPLQEDPTATETSRPTMTQRPSAALDPTIVLTPEVTIATTPTIEPTLALTPTAGAATPNTTPTPDSSYDFPYYLYVEKGSFTLTIYERGENADYTTVFRTYRVAHGGNKTPAGIFRLQDERERWRRFPKGGDTQFAVRYTGRLYTHSPMYGSAADGGFDPRNMWPKYYDGEMGIGTASTGGCLRMVTEAARFIYENCAPGTILEIVNGNPRGTTSPEPPPRNGLRQDPTDIEVG